METKRSIFWAVIFLSFLICQFLPLSTVLGNSISVIDDFESSLASGTDGNGIPVGFYTFAGSSSTITFSTTSTLPAPVPGATGPNNVLQMDMDVESFAGISHNFENAAADTWISQDWSAYESISFWLYGNNSGTDMFLDVLDNRNPGSTTDDAERWSSTFIDNFSEWQEISISFSDMVRKDVGNGAPNDGFGLNEIHGWTLGTLDTSGPRTYYVDNFTLLGATPVPEPSTMLLLGLGLMGLVRVRRMLKN